MYKIEILEEIEKVKSSMQEIEFKKLFYNIVLSEDLQQEYVNYSNQLTKLQNKLYKA